MDSNGSQHIDLLIKLAEPFKPEYITWKPGHTTKDGTKCMAMAYADLRAYQERLDQVCGLDWSVAYEPWGESRIIARLTIAGVTRSSTGEMSPQDEKNGMGGTVAEAQAMKRAAAMFGLGRYLYDLPSEWVGYDAQAKRISKVGLDELDRRYRTYYNDAMARTDQRKVDPVTGEIVDSSGAEDDGMWEPEAPERASKAQLDELDALGKGFYGEEWAAQLPKLVMAVTTGATSNPRELLPKEATRLIRGIERKKAAVVQSNGAHA